MFGTKLSYWTELEGVKDDNFYTSKTTCENKIYIYLIYYEYLKFKMFIISVVVVYLSRQRNTTEKHELQNRTL